MMAMITLLAVTGRHIESYLFIIASGPLSLMHHRVTPGPLF